MERKRKNQWNLGMEFGNEMWSDNGMGNVYSVYVV